MLIMRRRKGGMKAWRRKKKNERGCENEGVALVFIMGELGGSEMWFFFRLGFRAAGRVV